MVAIMKDKERQGQGGQDDLSDEAFARDWEETRQRIINRNPECPYDDGQKGSWVRMLGWQGAAEYVCPNGHRFSMLGDLVKKIEVED